MRAGVRKESSPKDVKMICRRACLLFVLSATFLGLLLGSWYLSSHLHTLSRGERSIGLGVATVGWGFGSLWFARQAAAWWGKRKREFPERAAQPEENMTVRCEVCDGDEFLEGPHGGLCTNIKCVACSAEYNHGPGIMERIHRN